MAVVLQRPGYASATTVHWLHPDFRGGLAIRLRDFGEFYTKAVVVLADASNRSGQSPLRLSLRLVESSPGTAAPHPAPPAGKSSDGASRRVSHTG
jgi:hypothetical protein